jgi:NTP pyrophosphatase (non-canonical NTP hydrolase)
MKNEIRQAVKRVAILTLADTKAAAFRNCPWKIFSSLVEEMGELAQALKVENDLVTHKKLNESARGEVVDVAICGFMMYAYWGGKWETADIEEIPPSPEPFEALAELTSVAGHMASELRNPNVLKRYGNIIGCLAMGFFKLLKGEDEEFIATVHKKLDKWVDNQAKRA